jgi:hypothetical protein
MWRVLQAQTQAALSNIVMGLRGQLQSQYLNKRLAKVHSDKEEPYQPQHLKPLNELSGYSGQKPPKVSAS